MLEGRGDGPVKRDLLLLFLCLCILGGAAWMGRDRVVSAVTAPVDVERVLILDAGGRRSQFCQRENGERH